FLGHGRRLCRHPANVSSSIEDHLDTGFSQNPFGGTGAVLVSLPHQIARSALRFGFAGRRASIALGL
ncbi:hypothetical protein, partial [Methylobacterium sp. GXS13]|uniref:hypothetical protein n=1 Tax=Methylobacterium sp. GXS13 TaxID=1730094 RepID=UPI001AEC814A